MRLRLKYLLLFVAGGVTNLHADLIEFNNGPPLEAVVVQKDASFVTVKEGNARIKLPLHRIKKITPGTEADMIRIEARAAFESGLMTEGLDLLAKSVRKGAEPAAVAELMMKNREPIRQVIASLNHDELDLLHESLAASLKADLPRPEDFLLARLDWSLELNDLSAVHQIMDELEAGHAKALDFERERLTKLFGGKIDTAMDRGQFSQALDLLVELKRLDQQQAGDRRVELILLWARKERDAGHYESALQIYIDQLMIDSPHIARDRISITLTEAEEALRAGLNIGRAIDIYEKYGLPYDPERSGKRLTILWRELGEQLLNQGKVEQARMWFERGNTILPGSADHDLARCDYVKVRDALDPEDRVGQFKLGEWCVANGLLDEARESFQIAGESELLRDSARVRVEQIEFQRTEKELARLLDLYESGDYIMVVQGISDLKGRPLAQGLREQTERLEQLARDAIHLSAAERPQQAEVLMQQAERAYWTGNQQEAFNLMQMLMEKYPDTPAAARALKFHQLIRQRLNLNSYEKNRRPAALPELPASFNPSADARAEVDPADPAAQQAEGMAREIQRLRTPNTTP